MEPETWRFPEAKGRDRGRRVWLWRRPAATMCMTFAEKHRGSEWTGRRTCPEVDRPLAKWGPGSRDEQEGPPAPELEDVLVGRFRWKC